MEVRSTLEHFSQGSGKRYKRDLKNTKALLRDGQHAVDQLVSLKLCSPYYLIFIHRTMFPLQMSFWRIRLSVRRAVLACDSLIDVAKPPLCRRQSITYTKVTVVMGNTDTETRKGQLPVHARRLRFCLAIVACWANVIVSRDTFPARDWLEDVATCRFGSGQSMGSIKLTIARENRTVRRMCL